jgi:alpha-glucuronidase
VEKFGKFVADHPDVLAFAAAAMTGFTVWRAYKYGTAVGAYRTLLGEQARAASEALGG